MTESLKILHHGKTSDENPYQTATMRNNQPNCSIAKLKKELQGIGGTAARRYENLLAGLSIEQNKSSKFEKNTYKDWIGKGETHLLNLTESKKAIGEELNKTVLNVLWSKKVPPLSTNYLQPMGKNGRVCTFGVGKRSRIALRSESPPPDSYTIPSLFIKNSSSNVNTAPRFITPKKLQLNLNQTINHVAADMGTYNPYKDFGADAKKFTLRPRVTLFTTTFISL
jgi:hypothetical protein